MKLRHSASTTPVLVRSTALILAAVALPASVRGQCTTLRVSESAGAVQADLASGVGSPNIARNFLSADGRYVAFWSNATNLVPNDTNGVADIFVKDRSNGAITRMSVDSAGVEGNDVSSDPAISHDGRWIVFQSAATNLVPNDTNAKVDIFLHDAVNATTVRVSVDSSGAQADLESARPDLSLDGRFIVYHSKATNLVAGDTNNAQDVFLHDTLTAQTERVSVDSAGAEVTGLSGNPSVSADGRWIAFHSNATTLVAVDTNGQTDVFVRDRTAPSTTRISTNVLDEEADFFSQTPSITPDGRYVAFSSIASNLVPNDTNSSFDVFVKDRSTWGVRRASVSSGGNEGNSTSQGNSISADGRFVGFVSQAWNLVAGDTNGGPFDLGTDVFVHDLVYGGTTRISADSSGVQADSGNSFNVCVAANGAAAAFYSQATNLGNQLDTNGVTDVFVGSCGSAPDPAPYCYGDGSGTACPCGNAGIPGHGCANSFNANGGVLYGTGAAVVSADTFTLSVADLPATSSALFFQGEAQIAAGAGAHFGDGLRCAGGAVLRVGSRVCSAGQASIGGAVPGDPLISVNGAVPATGVSLRYYQAWYRNNASFCNPEAYNLTNGITVVWVP